MSSGQPSVSLSVNSCAFRRAALTATGGFDEYATYALEETDVCLRPMARAAQTPLFARRPPNGVE